MLRALVYETSEQNDDGSNEAAKSAFATLQRVLNTQPEKFAKVGGDVAFYVKGAKPASWYVTNLGGAVLIREGNSPFPLCTVGINTDALTWLVEGTLDVAKAFRKRRLAVEGDLEALGRFVECFAPAV
jgi:hypothetical protein